MNSVAFDPDAKINMSLDEIILLTKGQRDYNLQNKYSRIPKRKKKSPKNRVDVSTTSHSAPLLSSTNGVDIYVSKKSPLLSAENRRRILQAVTNRELNSDLLEKSKRVIPATYKLIKTGNGVERVLIPAFDHFKKPSRVKLLPPRKLNKVNSNLNARVSMSLQDEPPPLIVTPIYAPHIQHTEQQGTPMEIDNPDDEIIILDSPNSNKMLEVIDVESDFPADALKAKKLCVRALNSVSQTKIKTLNDRFTMLSKNFSFN